MSDDYDIREESCPKCGHGHTHGRECNACDDGLIDKYDEDPMYYDEGDLWPCDECRGEGYFHWCPNCGFDLIAHNKKVMK